MRAVLVTLTVCLCTLPAYAKYSGGTGEPNDPYQIATAADLIALGETPADYGKHFLLTADIDLDPNLPGRKVFDKAVIAPDPWVCSPSGSCNRVGTSFTGVFDGSGHTISHLTIRGGGHVGLFGVLEKSAEVRNLEVVDVNITGSWRVGGLVGLNRGRLTRCRTAGTIAGSGPVGGLVGQNGNSWELTTAYVGGVLTQCCSMTVVSGNGGVGGLVGRNGGTIEASWAGGAVTGKESVGGLVGENADFPPWIGIRLEPGRILDCYSSCSVVGESLVGGLVGDNFAATVSGCHSVGAVTGTAGGYAVGGLVGNNSWGPGNYGSSDGAVIQCFWDTEGSGQTTSAGGTGKTTAEMQTGQTFLDAGWDFVGETANGTEDIWKIAEGVGYPRLLWEKYSGGTGEPNDPYQVATAADLIALGESPDYDKHFVLTADIDLDPNLPGRKVFDKAVIGYFEGVFNGNGHTISHLKIEGTGYYLGLFGYLLNDYPPVTAEVKNLGVVDADVHGSGDSVGALIGKNGEGYHGEGGAVVTRCYSTGVVTGAGRVGGLIGSNGSHVTQCYSTCVVTGSGSGSAWEGVGGLVGIADGGMLTNCYSAGAVSGTSYVGGLMGQNWSGTVAHCYSTGAVTGISYVGGLAGYNGSYGSMNPGGRVTDCYSTAAVMGTGIYAGGLVGENNGDVTHCYSAGAVDGNDCVGGLLGEGYGPVTQCFWDTQTSGQATSAGGTGKTTAEMQTASTFLDGGWDFVGETANGTEDIWWINEGKDYPHLWWETTEE